LQQLLGVVPPESGLGEYERAVVVENVLGKDKVGARKRTFRYLRELYVLRADSVLFRALRDLWDDDRSGQPLLAGLCALARDTAFRASAGAILEAEPGDVLTSGDLSAAVEQIYPGVYNEPTLAKIGRNTYSSWEQTGHLEPGAKTGRVRRRPGATGSTLAYALMLGYLEGIRGEALFGTLWARFSKVYRVRDDLEGEERAFKLFENAAGYEAVRREIGALRKIDHPHVVKVFWAGKTRDGDWYLITEFIDGESLEKYVDGEADLRDREAVDVALDVLDALVAIHPDAARISELEAKRQAGELSEAEFEEWQRLQSKGLVHRDIKPLNVMLTRTGAKLLDFNIASRAGDPVRTQSGTPPYQAPDADLTRWDVSTDLFAVGVMLYELLCNGRHPYPQKRPSGDEEVIDPQTVRPDLDDELSAFLVRACAAERGVRYQTAAEMKQELEKIRSRL
jgi:hypothetical protein